jgi:hypothetical protein
MLATVLRCDIIQQARVPRAVRPAQQWHDIRWRRAGVMVDCTPSDAVCVRRQNQSLFEAKRAGEDKRE